MVALAIPTTALATPVPAGWALAGRSSRPTGVAGQGLATTATGGSARISYRGSWSIPFRLRLGGWDHVGDPDAAGGYVFDAYQSSTRPEKLYEVTTPSGARYDYLHALVPGEAANNSFAAVSPDGRWLVSGEWGPMSRLLVFPTPLLNPTTPRAGGPLPLAGTVALDDPVADLQGCDFVASTTLLCSSNAPGKLVVRIDLRDPLGTGPATATVSPVFSVPQESACSGVYETEGIDIDPVDHDLRVEMIPPAPCSVATTIYHYLPAG